MDITDPAAPQPLSDWGIIADSDLLIQGGSDPASSSFQGLPGVFAAHFAHSVRAADDGTTAYVSYWDGGILKFDISDPANPEFLGRTIYPAGSSGDGHSMTPYDAGGTRYILQNDEDIATLPDILVTSSATGPLTADGIQAFWSQAPLTAGGQTVTGVVHDGCRASDYVGAAGRVALADTVDPFYVGIIPGWPLPPCTFGQQASLAAAAGAAALVSNLLSPDDAYQFFPGVDLRRLGRAVAGLPVFQIADIDDLAADIRAAVGPVTLTVTAQTPSWGYVRVFREDGTDEWQQVGASPTRRTRSASTPRRRAAGRCTTPRCSATVRTPRGTPTASWPWTSVTPRSRSASASSCPTPAGAMRTRSAPDPPRYGASRSTRKPASSTRATCALACGSFSRRDRPHRRTDRAYAVRGADGVESRASAGARLTRTLCSEGQ